MSDQLCHTCRTNWPCDTGVALGLLDAERERFPCGHRKADFDDSYGNCALCPMLEIHWDCEKEQCEAAHERDKLRARVKKLEKESSNV
jgi:hypothetical protein